MKVMGRTYVLPTVQASVWRKEAARNAMVKPLLPLPFVITASTRNCDSHGQGWKLLRRRGEPLIPLRTLNQPIVFLLSPHLPRLCLFYLTTLYLRSVIPLVRAKGDLDQPTFPFLVKKGNPIRLLPVRRIRHYRRILEEGRPYRGVLLLRY